MEPDGDLRFSSFGFVRLAADRDGEKLFRMLRSSEQFTAAKSDEDLTAGTDFAALVAAGIARASRVGQSEESLEVICTAMKRWIGQYEKVEDSHWMVTPLLWLCTRARKVSMGLDKAGSTDRYRKKLVEVHRETFNHLRKNRAKQEGCLTVYCELLRLYFSIGWALQCAFLLVAAVQGDKLDLEALRPRAFAVTLAFFWGKLCVLDGNVTEAQKKT